LQIEVHKLNIALEDSQAKETGLRAELDGWVRLFAEPFELGAILRLKKFVVAPVISPGWPFPFYR